MSAICPNCKSRLSCGCQKRSASNGATVCTMCINAYELKLKSSAQKPIQPSNTTPSNIQATYVPPKQ